MPLQRFRVDRTRRQAAASALHTSVILLPSESPCGRLFTLDFEGSHAVVTPLPNRHQNLGFATGTGGGPRTARTCAPWPGKCTVMLVVVRIAHRTWEPGVSPSSPTRQADGFPASERGLAGGLRTVPFGGDLPGTSGDSSCLFQVQFQANHRVLESFFGPPCKHRLIPEIPRTASASDRNQHSCH